MDHSLWTILILYGVIQGVVLSVTVFLKEKSLYLSLFFANISYLLFIYLFERFEWFRELPHLIWTNVPSWFLIGPLLYLYVKSVFEPAEKKTVTAQRALHFIPALGVLIYFWDFYFGLSGAEKIAAFTRFYSDTRIIDYVQLLYLAQISAYIYAAYRIVTRHSEWAGEQFSNSDFVHLKMLRKLFWGIGYFVVLAIIFSVLMSISSPDILPNFQFVFLVLASTVFIATAYYMYYSFSPYGKVLQIMGTAAKGSGLSGEGGDFNRLRNRDTYSTSSLDEKDLTLILDTIRRYMEQHEAFRRSDLKIGTLAEEVGIPSHHISQALNQELGKNFFDFVNAYRIEAVKDQLREGRHRQLTLFAIAEECGFNSQSSFYRIFKESTGHTPSSFIKHHISSA